MFFKKKSKLTEEYIKSVKLEAEKKKQIEKLDIEIEELERETRKLALNTVITDSIWTVTDGGVTCCRYIGYGCDENEKIIHMTTIESTIDFLQDRINRTKKGNKIHMYCREQLARLKTEKKRWGII